MCSPHSSPCLALSRPFRPLPLAPWPLQMVTQKAQYQPLAFFISCNADNDSLVAIVKQANSTTECVNAAAFKKCVGQGANEMREMLQWLSASKVVLNKGIVNAKLEDLRIRYQLRAQLMDPMVPATIVHPTLRMFLHVVHSAWYFVLAWRGRHGPLSHRPLLLSR
jgi:hypothetical protein